MTNQQHPITPPLELVQQWWAQETYDPFGAAVLNLATQAARWGADQELEACCEWLDNTDVDDSQEVAKHLRAARRPKPPSLKLRIAEAIVKGDKPVALSLLHEALPDD